MGSTTSCRRGASLLVLACCALCPLLAGAEEPRADAPAAVEAQPSRPASPPSLAPRLTAPPAAGPAQGEKAKGDAAAPAPQEAQATGPGPVLTVAEITEDTVRLAGPNVGLTPKQIGRVVARDGTTVGRVVVDRVLENGVVARVVSGRENISWGARVRFDAPPKR